MYIAIEGLDGSGNGTLITKLRKLFSDALFVREPGGTESGERIRSVILHSETPLDPNTEALLYMAARNELLRKVVAPAIEKGQVVISDRCYYSTLAYQGATGYANRELIERVTDITARRDPHPELILYLDIPVEVSRQRVRGAGTLDTIEKRDDEYFNMVREYYLECSRSVPNLFRLIDATQTPDEVYESVLGILKEVGVLGAS